jgi:hypothetical protein
VETRPCRSCRAKASNRVHRNLLQKCIFSKVFRCRVSGNMDTFCAFYLSYPRGRMIIGKSYGVRHESSLTSFVATWTR